MLDGFISSQIVCTEPDFVSRKNLFLILCCFYQREFKCFEELSFGLIFTAIFYGLNDNHLNLKCFQPRFQLSLNKYTIFHQLKLTIGTLSNPIFLPCKVQN